MPDQSLWEKFKGATDLSKAADAIINWDQATRAQHQQNLQQEFKQKGIEAPSIEQQTQSTLDAIKQRKQMLEGAGN